jgi:kynurenine formamidase
MRAVLPVTRGARAGQSTPGHARLLRTPRTARTALEVLADLARLRVIDLTHALHPAIPYWPGDGYGPFRYVQINTLMRDGKAAGLFEMPEHMGTHIDAPSHFVASPMSVDRIPLDQMLRPAVLFDIAERAALNPSAVLEPADVYGWEARYGEVPRGSVALVNSGWGSHWATPADFRNDADGVMRFPALSPGAASLLVLERGVVGIGVDTLSADNGEAASSPCHRLIHGAGGYILENLANLELVPDHGAFVLIAPLPIVGGTGSPARVLAFCNGEKHA